jgi:hypothetical protein
MLLPRLLMPRMSLQVKAGSNLLTIAMMGYF